MRKKQYFLQLNQYLSITVNGADRSAFLSPSFLHYDEARSWPYFEGTLYGSSPTGGPNGLYLDTLVQDFESGSSCVEKTTHHFLIDWWLRAEGMMRSHPSQYNSTFVFARMKTATSLDTQIL